MIIKSNKKKNNDNEIKTVTNEKVKSIEKEIKEVIEVVEVKNFINYDKHIPQHPCREKVYSKLYILLLKYKDEYNSCIPEVQKMALNIEKGIFNYSLNSFNTDNWTTVFKNFYIMISIRCYTNLNPDTYIKNTTLMHKLFTKEIDDHQIAFLNSQEIFPERYNEIINECKALEPKYSKPLTLEETPDGMHKCNNCARQNKPAYKTTYYQLQTRSAKKIGWKSTLPVTSWLCYWENSCSPSKILRC